MKVGCGENNVQREENSANCKGGEEVRILQISECRWAGFGRPRETWRKTINKEKEHLGFKSWGEAEVAARDRAAWRRRINGPILHEERRDR